MMSLQKQHAVGLSVSETGDFSLEEEKRSGRPTEIDLRQLMRVILNK